MHKIVVLDLDGTLCNDEHRIQFAQAGQWDEYHARCGRDLPHPLIFNFLEAVTILPSIYVLAITGREEKWKRLTQVWLGEHGAEIDEVLMRPTGDFTSAAILKPSMLKAWLAANPEAEAFMIIDNSEKVLRGYQEAGFPMTFKADIGELSWFGSPTSSPTETTSQSKATPSRDHPTSQSANG